MFEKIDCPRGLCVPICVSMKLSKHIDEERLNRAVRLTADAVPILKSGFDFDRCGWIEIENPEFIEITDKPFDEISIKSFDTEKNPPIKIVVSRDADRDTLVIFSDHGVSDARGFACVVYLIAHVYKKLGSDKSYAPNKIKLPEDRSYENIFRKYSDDELFNLAENEYNKSGLCKKYIAPYLVDYNPDAEFRIFSEFIDAKYLAEIKSFAHENSATVNDVLIAAYSYVLSKHFNDCRELIPMRMAIDLRYQTVRLNTVDKIKFMSERYLSDVLSKMLICTNYSVPVWLPVNLPKEKTLKNILKMVTESTRILKNESRGVGSAVLIEKDTTLPSLFDSRQAVGGPFVSNAGIIDDKMLDFDGGIEIEELLPYIHFNSGSPYSLAVVTWKGKITISSVDDAKSDLSSGLLKTTKEVLENLRAY